MTDAVDLGEYDLFDPSIQQCPFPWFEAMRNESPVFEVDMDGRPVWLVTTYDRCLEVISDTARFSSRFGAPGVPPRPELADKLRALRKEHGAYRFVPTLLTADPPEHTRYRKLVSRAFGPRSIAALEDGVRALASELLDSLTTGTVEFVSAYAVPFPVRVIARALNVPEDDLDDFKRWSDDTMAAQGSAISDERRLEAELGIIEFQKYFVEQLARRRAAPQDDILTLLVEASLDSSETEDGEPAQLDDGEILSILQQLLVAGNETTTKALGELLLRLAVEPEAWAALKADPALAKPMIEEALRLGAPGLAMWRIATDETELGGVRIPKGGRLLVVFGSANRDRAAFPAGESFCPAQSSTSHLAFGKGAHYCIGASLARLEMAVSLEELLSRVESVSLTPGRPLPYTPSFMLRGLEELHLDLVRTTS